MHTQVKQNNVIVDISKIWYKEKCKEENREKKGEKHMLLLWHSLDDS